MCNASASKKSHKKCKSQCFQRSCLTHSMYVLHWRATSPISKNKVKNSVEILIKTQIKTPSFSAVACKRKLKHSIKNNTFIYSIQAKLMCKKCAAFTFDCDSKWPVLNLVQLPFESFLKALIRIYSEAGIFDGLLVIIVIEFHVAIASVGLFNGQILWSRK